MQWTDADELAMRYAANNANNQPLVRTLIQKYGYALDDVLQELRLACLIAIQKHGNKYKRSTLISRAVQFRLLYLCRYEGKRNAIFE